MDSYENAYASHGAGYWKFSLHEKEEFRTWLADEFVYGKYWCYDKETTEAAEALCRAEQFPLYEKNAWRSEKCKEEWQQAYCTIYMQSHTVLGDKIKEGEEIEEYDGEVVDLFKN